MSGQDRQPTLKFSSESADVNFAGKVNGGTAMKCGRFYCIRFAAGWRGKYCIITNAGGIRFMKPILVGNIVEADIKLRDSRYG